MATRKRGPMKIDLTGVDGAAKLDAEFNPIVGKYFVRIGKRRYCWTATEFAKFFRQWLVRQKDGNCQSYLDVGSSRHKLAQHGPGTT